RRFFPKGMELGKLPKSQIGDAVFRINARPSKMLNFWSPLEFLAGRRVSLMLAIEALPDSQVRRLTTNESVVIRFINCSIL
ncbi:hypothetical protein MO867_21505, partial [Microbulbifer sp. OS29]|nr:hypothetical protein [Microbulbifer okhotskensis]